MVTGRRAFRPVIAVAAALALGACGGEEQKGPGGQAAQGGAEPQDIVYAQPTPPTLLFYPPIVAEQLGFFEQEKVRAKLAPSAEEISATAFLDNGDADISLADVDEIVIARSRGGEHQAIFSPQHSNTAGIVVPGDSPIRDFGGVSGKKVGLASEEDTALFEAMLHAEGISKDDVDTAVVGTSAPTLVDVLRKREIDAYVGAVSDFTALQANGVALRNITPEEVGKIDGNPMAVLPETLQEKRQVLVGFLRAWAKAQYLGWSRPEVVEKIMREEIPAEWRNEAVGEASLKQAIQLFEPDDPQRIGDLRPEVWETGQDLLFRVGILEERADVSTMLNDELIDEVNDWDRAAVDKAADDWAQQNP